MKEKKLSKSKKKKSIPHVGEETGEWTMKKKKLKAAVDRNHAHLLEILAAPPDHPSILPSHGNTPKLQLFFWGKKKNLFMFGGDKNSILMECGVFEWRILGFAFWFLLYETVEYL